MPRPDGPRRRREGATSALEEVVRAARHARSRYRPARRRPAAGPSGGVRCAETEVASRGFHKRTTGLEPATFGLGSRRSTN
jgi:hypothetical protein